MSPTLNHLYNLRADVPSTPAVIRDADTRHVHAALYPRSTNSGSSDAGLQGNTIIFIVVGVVCLLLILFGFLFVSRRAASKAARGATSPHTQESPVTPPPCAPPKRSTSTYWTIWKTRPPTDNTEPPVTVEVPTLRINPVAPAPVSPSPITPSRAMTFPLTARPSQPRRVTSLSVTTSFSHSHITQEDLNTFRISAYELDGDLETEMLNSARDDVWPGHVLAVAEGYGEMGIEEAMEAQANARHTGGSGCVDLKPVAPWRGSDYDTPGACQNMASGHKDGGGDAVGTR